MNDEVPMKVRQKTSVFLLLPNLHDLQPVPEEGFELFLQRERELQEAHVGRMAALPEVYDALIILFGGLLLPSIRVLLRSFLRGTAQPWAEARFARSG